MGFLLWLEQTWLAEWTSVSLLGYPLMITSHSVGMAVMVGLAIALDLRLLGWFREIPYESMLRFMGLAWVGFGLNFLSGIALFTMQASSYVTEVAFVSKMVLVVFGAATVGFMQTAVARDSGSWGEASAPGKVRLIAFLSIIFWIGAIITGRLIAYID